MLSMQIPQNKIEIRKSYQQRNFLIKSSTIKKILFLLFFICSFFHEQLANDLMNFFLLSIQIWRQKTKIKISGIDRFDLTICFCALIARFTIPELQSIILSLCFFSFKNSLSTILSSINLLKKIKNLSITIIFIILLSSYLFTYLYHSYQQTITLFGTFGNTCITMLEILTLDSWGSRGRMLEQQVGNTGIPSIFICIYVFLMNYFYMNILIGLILEILQYEQHSNQVFYLKDDYQQQNKSIKQSFIDNIMLGNLFQQIVMIFSTTSVIFNIYNNFQIVDLLGQIFDSIDDVLYTLHFLLLLILNKPKINYEKQKKERMILHFLAGPIALFLQHDLACLCNLTKLATTPIVRGVFSGTISIFPTLFPIILLLLSIILLFSVYTSLTYNTYIGFKGETYFKSLWQSFYTFVQLLTLDDWDANVLPIFEIKKQIIPFIMIPLFIIISNVILLNILIAFSCKYFKEIDYSINHQTNGEQIYLQNPLKQINQLSELKMSMIYLTTPQTIQEKQIFQREGLITIEFKNKIFKSILIK